MYKQKLDEILSSELSRKEFLRAGGVLILTLVGLPALLETLHKNFSSKGRKPNLGASSKNLANGYGARPYGK